MTLSRRTFLARGFGLLSLCLSPERVLAAVSGDAIAPDSLNGKTLLLIHLAGGNDGLNTLVPYADGHYYDARPNIAIKESDVLALDRHVGLHPAMSPLHELYKDGYVAIVQNVGYPQPSRSHFRSTDIWNTARPDEIAKSNWYGHLKSVDASNLAGNSFTDTLQFVAHDLACAWPSAVYQIRVDGFDTHANQTQAHADLLRDVAQGISSFQREIKALGKDDAVLTMIYSEFGRRLGENRDMGTDHGTSHPVFLLGKSVYGGLYGDAPDLARLHDGDVNFSVDFRQVIGSIIDLWLSGDSTKVLGSEFDGIKLIKA
jgi:uncharacterized protein (DUF1501 family)